MTQFLGPETTLETAQAVEAFGRNVFEAAVAGFDFLQGAADPVALTKELERDLLAGSVSQALGAMAADK